MTNHPLQRSGKTGVIEVGNLSLPPAERRRYPTEMMDAEWFSTRLTSDDLRSHWWAACQLMNAGIEGLPHLSQLLDLCDRLDLALQTDARERGFVLYATRSTGTILNAAGFDHDDQLHVRGCQWIHSVADCDDINIAAIGIWALGDLGTPPKSTVDRLLTCVHDDERFDPSGLHSLRSIAFRTLARVDRTLASTLVDTLACNEYASAMSAWIAAAKARPAGHYDHGPELTAESAWLLLQNGG